jgi:hypothetical protein
VRLSILENESVEAGDWMTGVSRDSLAAAASWSAKSGRAGGTALSVTTTSMPGGGRPPLLVVVLLPGPGFPDAEELALRCLLEDLLGEEPNEALRPKDGRRSRLRDRSLCSTFLPLAASRPSLVSEDEARAVEEEDVRVLLKKDDEKKEAELWVGVAPFLCMMTGVPA